MNRSHVKSVNRYIILKMRADAELAKLQEEYSEFVDTSHEELIKHRHKLPLLDTAKIQELGERINKIQTNINFYESQIANSNLYEIKSSYEYFDIQRINLS